MGEVYLSLNFFLERDCVNPFGVFNDMIQERYLNFKLFNIC